MAKLFMTNVKGFSKEEAMCEVGVVKTLLPIS